jgi:photosystem II stability/assembly factor-like uncharacterized protein
MSAFTICLGSTGAGVWVSHDAGKSWQLSTCDDPWFPYEYDVRALAASPHDDREVWVGLEGDHGEDVIAKSADAGASYERAKAPIDGRQVWSLGISPHDPLVIFAGTRPGGMLRSLDGGHTWEELPIGVAPECSVGLTRLLSIAFTDVPGEVWAGVEIDGIFHSVDNGETWSRFVVSGGESLLGPGEVWKDERHVDIHGVAHATTPTGERALIAATPIGVFRTTDLGRSWYGTRYPTDPGYDPAVFYTRCVATLPHDPTTILVGVGRRPPDHGSIGGIERSTDGGTTWMPVIPALRSVVWSMATHPALPGVVAAATLNGQVAISRDGGEQWTLSAREFGELRTVAITPATGRRDGVGHDDERGR